jgi:hypothetical protein
VPASRPALPPHRRLAAALWSAGCCLFLASGGSNIPLLVLGVVLFGVGIGNATSMPPLIAQTEFAKAEVVRVVALMTAVAQASFAFAPAVFGMIRDASALGGTAAVPVLFLTAALFQGAAALAYWAGRDSFRTRVVGAPVPT